MMDRYDSALLAIPAITGAGATLGIEGKIGGGFLSLVIMSYLLFINPPKSDQ